MLDPPNFEDIKRLSELAVSSVERMPIERSSIYIGYKLFWIIRRLMRGKQFPGGIVNIERFNNTVHDIVNYITQAKQMKILLDIDPAAYF
jgi:hypothetical protein